MPSDTLTLIAECERRAVATEVSSQRMVEWTITAPVVQRRTNRAPLNLALIVDRSGSMHGDKLRYVQQAACHVLDLLDERDRVAVVAYDDTITLLSRSTPVSDYTRNGLKTAINRLEPGGSTDLAGGWLKGCQEVAASLLMDGVNRALLLTDGLANRGITDIEELTQHARELRRRGVSTSTFGVGLDFNEHLLEAMAAQGGGHFFYIERPDQIPTVFQQELGELLTAVAREAVLRVEIPQGVAVEVLGDLAHERSDNQLRIFLGDISSGEQKLIYTRVLTPPDSLGTTLIMRGELSYANTDGKPVTTDADLTFTYMPEKIALLEPFSQVIMQRASEVEMATATARALKLERAGQRRQAKQVMDQTLAASAPYMPAPAAASYTQLAQKMEQGLDESDRKTEHYESYKKRQSRR